MIPLQKRHRYAAPPAFKPSKKDDSRIPEEHVVSYGLAALFLAWIKQQRSAEKRIGMDSFSTSEHEYLADSRKYGSILPPSCKHCPEAGAVTKCVDKEITIRPSSHHFSTMQSALEIASNSALPWAMHMINARQFFPPLAMAFLALNHEKKEVYQAYLEQDVV
jgi:hypothetical protein